MRFPPASQKPQRADLQGCLCPGRPLALPLGEVSPPTGRRHPVSESPAARVKPEPSWPLGLCGAQSARQPRCQSVDAKPRWVHPGEGAGCWPLLSPRRTSPAPQPPALLRCPELQKDWVLTSRLARGAGSQRGVCGGVSAPLRGRILRCSLSFLILRGAGSPTSPDASKLATSRVSHCRPEGSVHGGEDRPPDPPHA